MQNTIEKINALNGLTAEQKNAAIQLLAVFGDTYSARVLLRQCEAVSAVHTATDLQLYRLAEDICFAAIDGRMIEGAPVTFSLNGAEVSAVLNADEEELFTVTFGNTKVLSIWNFRAQFPEESARAVRCGECGILEISDDQDESQTLDFLPNRIALETLKMIGR